MAMTTKKNHQYFSLVEILLVFALLALLVSLLNPALKKTIQHALLVECQSHLKTVFAAILIYSDDNEGFCPGPCWDGQVARIYGSKNQIAEYTAPYLDVKTLNSGVTYNEAMVCPSNQEITTSRNYFDRQNFMTFSIKSFGRPFGRPNEAKEPEAPKLMSQIPKPQENIVLKEADFLNYPYPGKSAMPEFPVHFNTTRNVLYFDGHLDQESGL